MTTLQELLSSCANCLKTFESDSDRVTTIAVAGAHNDTNNPNGKNYNEEEKHNVHYEVHEVNNEQTGHLSHHSGPEEQVTEVVLGLPVTTSYGEAHHHEIVTLPVSIQETQQIHDSLEPHEIVVGGDEGHHHFQQIQVEVQAGETQELIEGVNIIVEKKPYLGPFQEELEKSIGNEDETQRIHGDTATNNKEKTERRHQKDNVTVLEAMSVVFEIPLESSASPKTNSSSSVGGRKEAFTWNRDDPCALCAKCAAVLTALYTAFREFNELSEQSSYVSRGLKQFLNKENFHNYAFPEVQIHEGGGKVRTSVLKDAAGKRGTHKRKKTFPRRKQQMPKKMRGSKDDPGPEATSVKQEITEKVEVDQSESDEDGRQYPMDQASEVSSDSNSLSDLEQEIQAPPEPRVSTRRRATKRQPSDYEEMESSEEDPVETFEDDEEEDPNFNAEEELNEMKVKQESLRLRKMSDICAEEIEYKEEDLKMDPDGRFLCPDPECTKAFKGLKTLNRHVVIHNLSKSPHCPKCSKEFESVDELHRHMKTNHAVTKVKKPPGRPPGRRKVGRPKKADALKRKYRGKKTKTIKKECTTCGKRFMNQKSLERHESQHIESGPVGCDVCNKEFTTPYYLKRHKRDVHEKSTVDYSCPECGELLTDEDTLKSHFEGTHAAKLNFCTHCGKSFMKGRYLRRHLVDTHKIDLALEQIKAEQSSDEEDPSHEGEQLQLSEQDKPTEDNPLMEPGERKRKADPTPYKCAHCDKEYKRKKQLDIHLLFHNGEEPQYSCGVCTKQFFQPRSLKRHMLLHSTENPHVCTECEKVFSRAELLNRHMQSAHSDEKGRQKKPKKEIKEVMEHKCTECDKVFTRKEYLRLHQRIHTGEKPFMCSDCGKTFRDPRNLAQHLVTHKTDRPFCCSICGLTFKRAHHLNDHEGTHREDVARPFVCTLPNCGKAFKLRKHLISHELVHSGTKDHQCEICGKAFNRKDNLRQHVNKVHGKDSFSDLIRVPAECHIGQPQSSHSNQVQVHVLTPSATSIPAGTTMTIQMPPNTFPPQMSATHFTYTHL